MIQFVVHSVECRHLINDRITVSALCTVPSLSCQDVCQQATLEKFWMAICEGVSYVIKVPGTGMKELA